MKLLFLFFFIFFLTFFFFGQSIQVHYTLLNNTSLKKNKYFKPFEIKKIEELNSILENKKNQWLEKGYYLASFKPLYVSSTEIEVLVEIGSHFPNVAIVINDSIKSQLRSFGIENIPKNSLKTSPSLFKLFIDKTLKAYANNGYPFAQVFFAEQEIIEQQIQIQMNISSGKFYRFSDIIVKGDSSISKSTVQNLIGIKINDFYSEEKLSSIDRILQQTNFINVLKKSELLFTENGVELYVYLENQKMSSMNGAVGLQPNPQSQKIGLTGDVQIKLQNVFKKAELIDLNWRSIEPQTQALQAKLNYPFLFKSPFGIDLKFNLYKRDSTFLDLKSFIGIQYSFKNNVQLKGFYQVNSSEILSKTPNPSSLFSYLAPIKLNSYGLSLQYKRINFLPNPSKGFSLFIETSIGNRTIKKENAIIEKSYVYKSIFQYVSYIPITKRNIIKVGVNFESYTSSTLFQNERYRFGGLNSLRGFNEEELFASTKLITSLEYRFLLDKNSNAFIFYDQGIYEDNTLTYKIDNPFGVGAGISFGSRIGIFSISYALGKQENNPLEFRNGKIHFGYVTYF
jgi:outer membrane protein assembly factor BamA